MASYSFDIVSTYDKAEVANALQQVQRDITNRFDFKNTPAAIEWLDGKAGYKLTGAGEWQIETLTDLVRRALIGRGQSTKILDVSRPVTESNLKATKDIPFVEGLDHAKAKQVTALLREELPKLKASIQGDAVRVTSGSKDELQTAMRLLTAADFDFPLSYINYR